MVLLMRLLFSSLCSSLYILDITGFSQDPGGRRMHKKSAFYTYACTEKSDIYRKIAIIFI
ncbi:hypothetical protein CN497_24575 [Priestia megaterium]|uniref:Uncharacterized protein n=1 Tax=Priestia megaterium TaxID=1404 RepID=A0AAE5U9U0_PRIMG|nr:hypothetical protein CN497_24575 [Priestia megaterium]